VEAVRACVRAGGATELRDVRRAQKPFAPDMVDHDRTRSQPLRQLALILLAPVVLVVLILAVPLVLVDTAWDRFRKGALRRQFLSAYGSQGKRALLVYSNSPNWQSYIEERWLPKLADHVVILNWSERATWSSSALDTQVFRRFSGGREFNPLAVIFRDPVPSILGTWISAIRRRDLMGILVPRAAETEVVRFWRACRDFKHGKDGPL
jgi:hypothetical protein